MSCKLKIWKTLLVTVIMIAIVSGRVQRLDTSADQSIGNLVEIYQSVCLKEPTLSACALLGSLEAGSSEDSVSNGLQQLSKSSTDMSNLASLFMFHVSFIQQEYKDLIIKNDKLTTENLELKNRLQAVESLYLQHVNGNLTEEERAHLIDPFGPLASSQPNLYSPSAIVLRPVDCSDHLLLGATKSGVYDIFPFRCRCSKPVKVWCDMETDGGGWTVFFARENLTVREDFNRSWEEHGEGFGNASGEYFLGVEHLHIMTTARNYRFRVDFDLADGSSKFSEWDSFYVHDAFQKYKLTVGAFQPHSMTIDCITAQNNNMFFSTSDYDNDRNNGNCPLTYKAGWWYNSCGTFTPGYVQSNGHIQTHCQYVLNGKKVNIVASKLQLKIRPKICGMNVQSAHFNSHTCMEYNFLH